MKDLKKDFRSVVNELVALTSRAKKIEKKIAKAEKLQGPAKARGRGRPRTKVAGVRVVRKGRGRRRAPGTAMEEVFGIIRRGRKGVDTTQIKKKTRFDDKKIWNAINRLKMQRRIKSARKGLYVVV